MKRKGSQNLILLFSLALVFAFMISLIHQPVVAYADSLDIKLNVSSKTLVKDKTFELKVYNLSDGQTISFKSDDTDIASIDQDGLITANAVGTCTVTANVKEDGRSVVLLTCDITVGLPAISVKLVQPTIFIMADKQVMLKTILQPWNTVETAKYSGFDTDIISVSAGGRITARNVGFTFLFASIDNGKYDLCRVFVLDESTYLDMLENPDFDTEGLMRDMILQKIAADQAAKAKEAADAEAVVTPSADSAE